MSQQDGQAQRGCALWATERKTATARVRGMKEVCRFGQNYACVGESFAGKRAEAEFVTERVKQLSARVDVRTYERTHVRTYS